MKKILSKWYLIIIVAFILFAASLFLVLGENSVISVHDNLDLFIPQYKMLKDTGTFFSHDVMEPFLNGIDRNYLPSEFNIYSFFYMFLPPYYAYVSLYILKIIIAVLGSVLLAKDILKDKAKEYSGLIYLTGFAYGLLNLFPNFAICFTSIPLLILLLRKIVNKNRGTLLWYILLLLYPLLSYFSYFGIFILGYMCLYLIYRIFKYKRFSFRMLFAVIVLAAGYVGFEYRLFMTMLFSNVESIRGSMVIESLDFKGVLSMIWEGIAKGDMHSEALQLRFVMPVCFIFAIIELALYIKNKEIKKVFTDPFFGILLFIVFNGTIYGLYYCGPVRNLFDKLFAPLAGLQFNRTGYFNPFLWYVALFIVAKRIYDFIKGKSENGDKNSALKGIPYLIVICAIFVTVVSGTRYNDLLHTCVSQYHLLRSGEKINELSYSEYFSEDLFKKALEDIKYSGDWAAAYGFHPAVLEYNGIKTIDGYLGYYPLYYKQRFRKAIAPALDQMPESASYFDNWGARCTLYSGTYPSNVTATRNYDIEEEPLYIDTDAFKYLDGRYIFSRVRISNAEEAGFTLEGVYTDENSPYTLYVYRTTSRYISKYHSDIPFEDRILPGYDYDELISKCDQLTAIADKATKYAENNSELSSDEIIEALGDKDVILALYDELIENFDIISTEYVIAGINYNLNVTDDTYSNIEEEIYADYLDIIDRVAASCREIALSPYESVLRERLDDNIIQSFKEYEDMTDEEKELKIREEQLESEYYQASIEEYYYEYNGKEWTIDELFSHLDTMESEEILNIYNGIYENKAQVLCEIYKELVNIRIELAEIKEYDSFSDYAYEAIFGRDYTTDDVLNLCKEIKKSGSLYIDDISDLADLLNKYNPGVIVTDTRETYEQLKPYIYEIDEELGYSLDYMLRNNLFNMDYSELKPDIGYTTNLDYYGDAFIFDSPYQGYNDLYTCIHEFGHYNHMFNISEPTFGSGSNLDVSEIHSQGLEMLFTPYYKEIYGKEIGSFLEANEVNAIASAIFSGVMNAEFEIYVYDHPDATYKELGREYKKIYKSYGWNPNGDADEYYGFVDIAHLFTSPHYYISYATSALSALEIYNLAYSDRNYAIQKYMQISTYPSAYSYCGAMEFAGLSNIFENGVSKRILRETCENLEEIINENGL